MSGRPLDVSDTATTPPEVSAAIIRDFALSVRPMEGFVLTLAVFGSMLIPILIILLYLSSPTLRRKPIFILNVLSIIVGIALAIWGVYVELTAVIAPWKKVPIINNTIFAVFLLFAPWLSELVLLLRLVAVYPPSTTPQAKLALTFTFPIICKTIRFVCLILWLQYYAEQCGSHNVGNAFAAAKATDYKSKPWMQIEWFLQMADNTYVSALFIIKLVRSNAWKEDIDRRMSLCGDSSFSAQLKQLLCIAVYNFVIPVILNVAILIELYTDPNYHVNTTYLLFVNFYVSIIAVVFATIWSSSYSFRSRQGTTKLGKDTELNWRVSTPSMSLETCNASPVTAEQDLTSSDIKGQGVDWDVEYYDGAHVSAGTPPRSTMHADRREHRKTV